MLGFAVGSSTTGGQNTDPPFSLELLSLSDRSQASVLSVSTVNTPIGLSGSANGSKGVNQRSRGETLIFTDVNRKQFALSKNFEQSAQFLQSFSSQKLSSNLFYEAAQFHPAATRSRVSTKSGTSEFSFVNPLAVSKLAAASQPILLSPSSEVTLRSTTTRAEALQLSENTNRASNPLCAVDNSLVVLDLLYNNRLAIGGRVDSIQFLNGQTKIEAKPASAGNKTQSQSISSTPNAGGGYSPEAILLTDASYSVKSSAPVHCSQPMEFLDRRQHRMDTTQSATNSIQFTQGSLARLLSMTGSITESIQLRTIPASNLAHVITVDESLQLRTTPHKIGSIVASPGSKIQAASVGGVPNAGGGYLPEALWLLDSVRASAVSRATADQLIVIENRGNRGILSRSTVSGNLVFSDTSRGSLASVAVSKSSILWNNRIFRQLARRPSVFEDLLVADHTGLSMLAPRSIAEQLSLSARVQGFVPSIESFNAPLSPTNGRIQPIDNFIKEGFAKKLTQQFRCPTIFTTGIDKTRNLRTYLGNANFSYPFIFVNLTSVSPNTDIYMVNKLARVGIPVRLADDNTHFLMARLIPVKFELEVEYYSNTYTNSDMDVTCVDGFIRRWLFSRRNGALSYNIDYGLSQVSVNYMLSDQIQSPVRESQVDAEAVYKVVCAATINGYISDPELSTTGRVKQIFLSDDHPNAGSHGFKSFLKG